MKPKRIILIRHGESEGNVDDGVYGVKPDYALELTERGRAQADDAGLRLRALRDGGTSQFYVSPMWRTRETFERIARRLEIADVRYREEPRIREQEWGHLRDPDERAAVTLERAAYGTFYYRIPDGESCADVYDRITTFLETLHRDFRRPDYADNAVIVTHGMLIRLFLMRWFRLTVEDFEALVHPPNCEIVVLELQDGGGYKVTTPLARHPAPRHPYQRPIKI